MSSLSGSVSPAWKAIIATLDEAEVCVSKWVAQNRLSTDNQKSICEEWKARRETYIEQANAGAVVPKLPDIHSFTEGETPSAAALRLWNFLHNEINRLLMAGVLTQFQGHFLKNEAEERKRQLLHQLMQEGGQLPLPDAARSRIVIPSATPKSSGPPALPAQAATKPETPKTHRHILEMLLDPRSIQWLLGLGGALMVVGLVILLWINKFFTPPKMAVAMGLVNVAFLFSGWGLIQRTRYQIVGRGFTLLACLVMPLNLWYYHTQGLVSIDGHLWVAAVMVCALYGASALVLKDEMFAYVFCAGVAMTGLLILADWPPSPAKFWEIASPATLLVILGLAAIHGERAFSVQDGPFSRQRFGLAFFRSGHVLMAGGLLMLFIAKLAGDWLYEPIFQDFFRDAGRVKSPICGEL